MTIKNSLGLTKDEMEQLYPTTKSLAKSTDTLKIGTFDQDVKDEYKKDVIRYCKICNKSKYMNKIINLDKELVHKKNKIFNVTIINEERRLYCFSCKPNLGEDL